MGKRDGKSPFEIPRRRWEDNITTDIQELGCEVVDWIYLAQDRGRWQDECGNGHSGCIKHREFIDCLRNC